MQFLCGNANFGAQTKFTAVGETRGPRNRPPSRPDRNLNTRFIIFFCGRHSALCQRQGTRAAMQMHHRHALFQTRQNRGRGALVHQQGVRRVTQRRPAGWYKSSGEAPLARRATMADSMSLSPNSISSVETVSFSLTMGMAPRASRRSKVFMAFCLRWGCSRTSRVRRICAVVW